MKYVIILLFAFLLVSCADNSGDLTADEIVDKAIENAGGDRYNNAEIDFVFRKRKYRSKREGGKFQLERIMTDSTGNEIRDILDNEGLERYVNDSAIQLPDSLKTPIGNSVNSVHYFVHLPFGLNAPAANKKLVGKDSIGEREYYEVKVTFSQNGGGTDHEDEYLYWIDTQTFKVDYLAYNFETNDGGIRFRKAYNPRIIKGIRFVDYQNYKYEDLSTPLSELDSLFEARELELLSVIETEDVEVTLGS
ncbi:deoxyribose-phosphate aldolase [Gramella jeungdoensis]|uniref:Deoxyribose-phosphate aldolase n=1 Tax=Gramella jeungdoensis TaxID=708091 RepID=A0ABT0YXI8_9FLAO|nr:DUF6503 family protein [Gramella jeungdoensis]MCM8568176.1 deoxyribose-phosphate aldolase [Gramella jeungdoensis]